MKMTIGTAIRTVRTMKNLQVWEVAQGAKVSRGYVTQIEHDLRNPTWDILQKIAGSMNIPVSYLTMMVESDHQVIAPLTAIVYTQMFEGLGQ